MANKEKDKTLVEIEIAGQKTYIYQWMADQMEKDAQDIIDAKYSDMRLELMGELKDGLQKQVDEFGGAKNISLAGWEITVLFGIKQGKVAIMDFAKTKKRNKK